MFSAGILFIILIASNIQCWHLLYACYTFGNQINLGRKYSDEKILKFSPFIVESSFIVSVLKKNKLIDLLKDK